MEKIVQLEISLPVLSEAPLFDYLWAQIGGELLSDGKRYGYSKGDVEECLTGLTGTAISTPRDALRLANATKSLLPMVSGEVNTLDFANLQVLRLKAPDHVETIRQNIELFASNGMDWAGHIRRSEELKGKSSAEVVDWFFGKPFPNRELEQIFWRLFPHLAPDNFAGDLNAGLVDRIARRRSLNVALCYGLQTSDFSRPEVERIVSLSQHKVESAFRELVREDRAISFLGRLVDVYAHATGHMAQIDFWLGVLSVIEENDEATSGSIDEASWLAEEVDDCFESIVSMNPDLRPTLKKAFYAANDSGLRTITSSLTYGMFFKHGLFGHEDRNLSEEALFGPDELNQIAEASSARTRECLLDGKEIARLLTMYPLFILRDVGHWDKDCTTGMQKILSNDAHLDRMLVQCFGRNRSTDANSLYELCGREFLRNRCRERHRHDHGEMQEEVRAALAKALRTFGLDD